LLIGIQKPLEVLPGTLAVADHEVVLSEFEEAEEVKSIKSKGLAVEAER
jgi:hypothetical protein